MSFSFDPSKNQGTASNLTPSANAGVGDASKTLSTGFAMPTMQSQAKPGGLFGLAFGSQAAPTFGASSGLSLGAAGGISFGASPAQGLSFGAPSTAAPTLSFGAPSTAASGISFGTPSTAAPAMTFGAPSTAASGISFGTPSTAAPTLSFGAASTAPALPSFGAPATAAPTQSFGAPASAAPTLSFGGAATTAPNLSFGMGTSIASTGLGSSNIQMPGLTSAPSFRAQPVAANTAPVPTTGFFGANKPASTLGFSLGGGAATSTPASAPGVSFGATPIPAAAPGSFSLGGISTPATTGISFGLATSTPAVTSAPASSAPAPSFNLTATTAAPTTQGFSLTAPAPTSTTSLGFSIPGTTSSAATGFSLGSTAPAISTGFSLNKTTTATSTATVPSTTAPQTSLGSVTTVTPSSASGQTGSMNFCQLEEAINKWTLELEEQEKAFVNQAAQVNAWDKLLIANGEKIVTLNEEVERVKLEQQQLEHELDYVVGQQKELQDCLDPLEKELASLSVSDPEREYTYRLAETLDTQLKQMSEDLKEIIEHLNEANRLQDPSDPIVQIGKILNAHMNSLQWLDERTSILGQKIQQIDQMHQNYRQENERSFSLAYN